MKKMERKRVVITGLGVVAPNGIGLAEFEEAIKEGRSGIRFFQELADLKFACQIGGVPVLTEEIKAQYFSELEQKKLHSEGVIYGIMAGLDAWKDANLSIDKAGETDWDTGCIFGAGLAGINVIRDCANQVDALKVRRLGTMVVQQTMPSGISAYLGGKLGLGNQVSTNASACSTGTEAILLAAERIRLGKAKRMLAGSCDAGGPYVWGGFDSMRVLNRKSNDAPEKASRPMSESAAGFVPACGAGALVLESLESAKDRGARIYAEVLGGGLNAGGQRSGGSMTAPNAEGVRRCIQMAIEDAQIHPNDIDAICGHLTATMGDALEIDNWTKVLNRRGGEFPYINSLKAMIGHCLSAAGSIESVACILELYHQFLFPSINCEDIHPKISTLIASDKIPQEKKELSLNVIAKSGFGFGDVNSCLIFGKW